MTKLAQKILKIVQQKTIKPRPRWIFQVKNIFIWLALAIWTILGSLASAMTIDQLRFNDWSLALRLGGGLAIKSLPYFWLVTLILTIIVAKKHFQKTKHGYRYTWTKITASCLLISLVAGSIIAYSGWGRQIDNQLAQKEIYRRLNCQDKLWYQPNNGLLSGTIRSLTNNAIYLTAPDNSNWLVEINKQTIIEQPASIDIGQAIKVLGQISAPQVFTATEIKPHTTSCGCGHCRCDNCRRIIR
jgi:hypothetical protein